MHVYDTSGNGDYRLIMYADICSSCNRNAPISSPPFEKRKSSTFPEPARQNIITKWRTTRSERLHVWLPGAGDLALASMSGWGAPAPYTPSTFSRPLDLLNGILLLLDNPFFGENQESSWKEDIKVLGLKVIILHLHDQKWSSSHHSQKTIPSWEY